MVADPAANRARYGPHGRHLMDSCDNFFKKNLNTSNLVFSPPRGLFLALYVLRKKNRSIRGPGGEDISIQDEFRTEMHSWPTNTVETNRSLHAYDSIVIYPVSASLSCRNLAPVGR